MRVGKKKVVGVSEVVGEERGEGVPADSPSPPEVGEGGEEADPMAPGT